MRKVAWFVVVLSVLVIGFLLIGSRLQNEEQSGFDGQKALADVEYQISLGPRLPETPAHNQAVEWIQSEMKESGWETEVQETERMGHPVRNIIARRGTGRPWVILGAHYDSRLLADRDPDPARRLEPVPGANDGGSGVAVLLELGRVLPRDLETLSWTGQIWLVFFDAEDNGNIPGWDWILGSQAFVEDLQSSPEPGLPDYAVIVDMIGDADLNIYQERNSDPELSAAIWNHAARLGYSDSFIPTYKHSILDDHTPFLRAGVQAADLIDFDYPYYHTTSDTADKISAESLDAVGETLLAWLLSEQ